MAQNDIAVYVIIVVLAAYSIWSVWYAKRTDHLNKSITSTARPRGLRRATRVGHHARLSAVNDTLPKS